MRFFCIRSLLLVLVLARHALQEATADALNHWPDKAGIALHPSALAENPVEEAAAAVLRRASTDRCTAWAGRQPRRLHRTAAGAGCARRLLHDAARTAVEAAEAAHDGAAGRTIERALADISTRHRSRGSARERAHRAILDGAAQHVAERRPAKAEGADNGGYGTSPTALADQPVKLKAAAEGEER